MIYVLRLQDYHMRIAWFFVLFMALFQCPLYSQGTSIPVYNGKDETISLVVYNSPVSCRKNFAVQLNLKRGLRNGDELVQWKLDYTGCDGKRYTADMSTPIGITATNANDILSFASSFSNELVLEHAFIFPSSELSNLKVIIGVREVRIISEHETSGLLMNENDSLSYSVGVSVDSIAQSKGISQKYAFITVQIGNQLWMAENLNVDRFINGDIIPEARTIEDWKLAGRKKQPAWCYYKNDPLNGNRYGKLYNWYAVNDSRGLSPQGWHLPNEQDWTQLLSHLGGEYMASVKMKSPESGEENVNFNIDSSFNAKQGGYRDQSGYFYSINYADFWWIRREGNDIAAWYQVLNCANSTFNKNQGYKDEGFSVRCIHN